MKKKAKRGTRRERTSLKRKSRRNIRRTLAVRKVVQKRRIGRKAKRKKKTRKNREKRNLRKSLRLKKRKVAPVAILNLHVLLRAHLHQKVALSLHHPVLQRRERRNY